MALGEKHLPVLSHSAMIRAASEEIVIKLERDELCGVVDSGTMGKRVKVFLVDQCGYPSLATVGA